MTSLRNINTKLQDTFQADAFGRGRVSTPDTRLDVEFIYDKQEEFFDEITNNGTVTHNPNSRDLTFALSSVAPGSKAEMRSHPVPYTPGNSQLIEATGVLNLASIAGGTTECFLRSSITGAPVEVTYPQSTWIDEEGSASLRTGLDWGLSHIFLIDFQSLKVGRIRFGIVTGGIATQVMTIENDNLRDSGYWQVPSLPVYWNLYHSGAETFMEVGYGDENNAVGFRHRIPTNLVATMKAICCTVKSEGGNPIRTLGGLSRGVSMGTTTKSVSSLTVWQPLISIRATSLFQALDNLGVAIPRSISIQTDNPIELRVVHDGVLTGPVWTDVDVNNSCVEYDVTASAVTGGHNVVLGYAASGKNLETAESAILGKTVLWSRKGTQTGIFTILARKTTATSATVLAAMNWEEIR